MANAKFGSTFSCSAASLSSSPFQRTRSAQVAEGECPCYNRVGAEFRFISMLTLELWPMCGLDLRGLERLQKQLNALFVVSEDQSQYCELETTALVPEDDTVAEDISPVSNSYSHLSGSDGKPDFLILFFTEAIFYCGVGVFLYLLDHVRRPLLVDTVANNSDTLPPQLGQRVSSVATLVLSLVIPMVTMGLVWPWTGPAASATLAPYLVGIVVQFAFEQYARYRKSPSWSAIPLIFQVYRLHQLNRAAQLVTALSFTVRGAEMTSHNMAINSSLGTLLNVLQFLGVICIWSLSSFLMRFIPYASTTKQ
ncbi:hypothetical protein JHK85_016003 [Glycine max]|nr:hypothetical protein JHK85_016003 [Glycine max]